MARVFVTGSADGLGLMAGRLLAEAGHAVVLHARSAARAEATRATVPKAEAVLVGDLSTIAAMRDVAKQANERGRFDAVIHNVGLGYQEPGRDETADGLTKLWAVNVLAPYVLTALMHKPQRLVYLSSGMHKGGDASLDDLQWAKRRWNGSQAYSDTKLHDVLLAFGIARRWPDVLSNAMTPGWVATRMGGKGAPDDLDQGHRTQVWLAVSEDKEAKVTGRYFYHQRVEDVNPSAKDTKLQERLIDYCREVSGVALTEGARR
jgi:NAD(P)-dependent dehydrogenase (short-subunit alcohol dehydrogenase family)